MFGATPTKQLEVRRHGGWAKLELIVKAMQSDEFNRAMVLAIASGKGGVGKTNISANLSICLAASQKRVILMDADLGLGNLDVIMDVNSRYNLSHLISGQKTLDQIIQVGPGGVKVICCGSGLEQMANINPFQRQRLIRELETLQKRSDILIIDTGAGINENVIGFCTAADQTLVVTTPEPTSLTDAYAVIKVLASRKYTGKISLLVNMADSAMEGKKIYRHLSQVVDRFLKIPLYEAGTLCRDDSIYAAVRRRQPTVLAFPKSPFTMGLEGISARLGNTITDRNIRDGFFRKVVNWFF